MNQVRKSVFETNSSSVHSITMCKESEYNRWQSGELYYRWGNFITREEADEIIENDRRKWNPKMVGTPITEETLRDEGIYTFDAFWEENEERYEAFEDHLDGVVAFGYYGHDY